MAICLRRLPRSLNIGLLNARRHATFSELRSIQNTFIPGTVEIGVNHTQRPAPSYYARLDEGNIWMRGVAHRDLTKIVESMSAARLTTFEKRMILLSERTENHASQQIIDTNPGRPSAEQLEFIRNKLAEYLPNLFVKPMDYTIFHVNLIFENNIRGTHTVGVYHYAKQVGFLKIIGHLKFAYVKFEILKITSHIEDGTIRVRWRIRGVTGLKVMLNFWKFKVWDVKEAFTNLDSWYDGFSTFYVSSDGLVYKHVVDKMMPDNEGTVASAKTPLAAKVALIMGLVPRECLTGLPDTYVISYKDVMLPLERLE